MEHSNNSNRPRRVQLFFVAPGADGETPIALLEKRCSTEHKTWAGLSTAPIGGKLEPSEDDFTALTRLISTRIRGTGGLFRLLALLSGVKDAPKRYLLSKGRVNVYGLPVDAEVFNMLNPTCEGDQFTQVTLEGLAQVIRAEKQRKHVPYDEQHPVVFPHVPAALQRAFGRFRRRP